jgi:hypothetical protein
MRARTSCTVILAGISGVLVGKQEVERVQQEPSYNLPEVRNQEAPIDPLSRDFHVRVIQVEKGLPRNR